MTKKIIILLSLISLFSCDLRRKLTLENYTQYVDNFMGTKNGLGAFPGPCMPFGMVQLSPDTGFDENELSHNYKYTDSIITGFSHRHLAGANFKDFCDIPIMPTNSKAFKSVTYNNIPFSTFSHKKEGASPGYYWVDLLDSGIKAELTTTQRVGLHRYTFPQNNQSKIVLNLGNHITGDVTTYSKIKVVDSKTIEGIRYSNGGAGDEKLFFVLKASKPFNDYLLASPSTITQNELEGDNIRLELNYNTSKNEQIILKVAISNVSVSSAYNNLYEVPDFNFDKVKNHAQDIWQKQLEKIQIKAALISDRQVFYTMLYHTMLSPNTVNDLNGSYRTASDSIYNLEGNTKLDNLIFWGGYKSTYPLMSILNKETFKDVFNNILINYEHKGSLSSNSVLGNNIPYGVGDNAIPILASALSKGFTMDLNSAYNASNQAMNDAKNEQYLSYGFFPYDLDSLSNHSASKSLENYYNDWCLSILSYHMGNQETTSAIKSRSENWRKLFDINSNFFRPKSSKDEFISIFKKNENSSFFYKSTPLQNRFYALHQPQELISSLGGNDIFQTRLDSVFLKTNSNKYTAFDPNIPQIQNVMYLYNYTSKPSHLQEQLLQIINEGFDKKETLLDNDQDFNQIASWFILNCLGIYPIDPASDKFMLATPAFREIIINFDNNKKFRVVARNLSDQRKYVKDLYFNNKVYPKLYLSYSQILAGGYLVLDMTDKPQDERLSKYEKP